MMSAISDVDLSAFCGRIGNLYTRYRLSPPFALYDAAQGWMVRGIPLSHCVYVIERYLDRYGRSCPSGSGDRNFAWLNSLIQTTWYDRTFARPPRPTLKRTRDHEWLDEYGAEGPRQKLVRAAFTAVAPNPAGCEPGRVGLRQKATRGRDNRSAFRQQGSQPPRSAPKSSGQDPSRKKIDLAVAWLCNELASGERAAAEVEANARCAGIAPRTYDRARQRLGVTSRRIGFGRFAKYMIALPAARGTPNAATELGVI